MRRLIICLLLLLLFVVTVVWYANYFDSPPVDLQRVHALAKGATKDEVIKAIGPPQSRFNDDHEWSYHRPLAWPILYILFDENGRYVEYEYDW